MRPIASGIFVPSLGGYFDYQPPVQNITYNIRWHNGSAFVFCSCGCTFESEPSPTSAHACGEVTGCAPAAKRSASVAPEVNLGECTLHSPPQT